MYSAYLRQVSDYLQVSGLLVTKKTYYFKSKEPTYTARVPFVTGSAECCKLPPHIIADPALKRNLV